MLHLCICYRQSVSNINEAYSIEWKEISYAFSQAKYFAFFVSFAEQKH